MVVALGVGRDVMVLLAVSCLPLSSCCWAARSELNGHQGGITNVHLSQQCGASPQVKELPWQAGGTELVGRAPGTGWEVFRVKQGHLGEGCKRCES